MPAIMKREKREGSRLNGFKSPNYWVVYTIVFLIACALVYNYFLFSGKFFIWSSDGENQHLTSLTYSGFGCVIFSAICSTTILSTFRPTRSGWATAAILFRYYTTTQ